MKIFRIIILVVLVGIIVLLSLVQGGVFNKKAQALTISDDTISTKEEEYQYISQALGSKYPAYNFQYNIPKYNITANNKEDDPIYQGLFFIQQDLTFNWEINEENQLIVYFEYTAYDGTIIEIHDTGATNSSTYGQLPSIIYYSTNESPILDNPINLTDSSWGHIGGRMVINVTITDTDLQTAINCNYPCLEYISVDTVNTDGLTTSVQFIDLQTNADFNFSFTQQFVTNTTDTPRLTFGGILNSEGQFFPYGTEIYNTHILRNTLFLQFDYLSTKYYNKGWQQGNAEGYEEGNSHGIEIGKEWGYELGYEQGEEVGYDNGYKEGFKQGQASGSPTDIGANLFTSLFKILQVEIFPNFSLSILLTLIVAFVLISILIKLIKG